MDDCLFLIGRTRRKDAGRRVGLAGWLAGWVGIRGEWRAGWVEGVVVCERNPFRLLNRLDKITRLRNKGGTSEENVVRLACMVFEAERIEDIHHASQASQPATDRP